MKPRFISRVILLLVVLASFAGCRTHYQRQALFHSHFQTGDLEAAIGVLEHDRRSGQRRNRLLYLMDRGVVHHMMGEYAQSNIFLEEAYILGQDYRTNYGDQALALVVNQKVTEYRGEPFEMLMIHYFKAMNFTALGELDAALVECRRLIIELNALSDRHESKNRYARDAFVHNLMGMLYEASGDHNNAFIAYRNALEIYLEDYQKLFGLNAPQQLKRDLLRTAHRNGFRDELRRYEAQFDMQFEEEETQGKGDLVFFWQNGLGPVKDEVSMTFTLVRGVGGQMNFVNEQAGLSFPLPASEDASGDLGDVRVVRVAFPKYVERPRVYTTARLVAGSQRVEVERAQDINAIAFQALDDRMLREMGGALLRLAIRQLAEQRIRKEDESLGALFGLVGALTEQADTRNWQTLPHSIHYARVRLPAGVNSIQLEAMMPGGNVARTVHMEVNIRQGQTTFINFHTLDARPPGM